MPAFSNLLKNQYKSAQISVQMLFLGLLMTNWLVFVRPWMNTIKNPSVFGMGFKRYFNSIYKD